MKAKDVIMVRGARVNNLKNVSVTIPRNSMTVFTGVSGSGKSSLAFDTIYAEGQRRYIESLSSYARMFLGQMDKPDVDQITGLSPAISIDQKTTSRNPRSTVGTVTEIHDYLRLLYARIGIPHCPLCGREIRRQSVDQILGRLMQLPERTRLILMAPVIRGRKGEHAKLLESYISQGFVRGRFDGEFHDLSDPPVLDKNRKHTIEIVIDRVIVREGAEGRLTDSIETAMRISGGLLTALVPDESETTFSQNYACPDCGVSFEELSPRMFSFNNPYGACPACTGLGFLQQIDPDLVIPDPSLSLNEGAIRVMGFNSGDKDSDFRIWLIALAEQYGFSLDEPVSAIRKEALDKLLYGTKGEKIRVVYERDGSSGSFQAPFEGIITSLERRSRETGSETMREMYTSLMFAVPCPQCKGKRLKPEALAVTVGGLDIMSLSDLAIVRARKFIDHLALTEREEIIGRQIVREISSRLSFLDNVGLSYLTLSRNAGTLSGGEAQRIRLATQIGSALVGVLYVLDEPSIGLHQRDNRRLLNALIGLKELGNTLIIVEHDEETIRAADWIVDVGPAAGIGGGRIVAQGTLQEIMDCPGSVTGLYLSGKRSVPVPAQRRTPTGWITVKNARANNLKGIDVRFPLGVLTCVTGVSGSGKSSLVNEIMYKALSRDLNRANRRPGAHDGIEGIEALDKIIAIDQSPIGRTPRSNPATYTGIFDLIRDVFAATPDARAHGYKSNRFSFNVKGGRCEACSGDGIVKIEMHFLSDVYVPCEVCGGKRYNRETLEIRYKGKNISEVLDMTIAEALDFFSAIPRIESRIRTLNDVGLGYMKLGQPSTELSGGEAQRIKLATELMRRATGRTIYLLDEPTTGLHVADIEHLNAMLSDLVDAGNTVIVIEHDLDVIKTADWVIDLGPEGGDGGGTLVAEGTPEDVSGCEESWTGRYLRHVL